MKKFLTVILIILILFAGAVATAAGVIKKLGSPVSASDDGEKVRIEIPSGMSVSGAAKLLAENQLIRNEKLFYYTARYPKIKSFLYGKGEDKAFILRSGIYYISPSMNIAQIQEELSSGQQEYIKVAIPEGLTISKIAAELEEKRICPAKDFIEWCHNPNTVAAYEIPGESLEGFLFPDTYYLTGEMSASAVADIMIMNFFDKVSQIPSLAEMNNADLYQTVTLASIVEREYRVEDEAPLIASVFKNRLRRNIGLYSCATIEYILTEIEGRPHPDRILIEDTKIDNPYNTYKWAGLPPGPISNPGLVALKACADTPKTDYYFFQVVDPAAGRHVFTTNFDEHVQSHSLYTKKSGR
ncbi:UPF0755 protein [Treponema bryantii]|uniref:Endolytic murein transglycosylase n=1 Tax=Treponema bryantii TaxID=163 RepID=A0A1I3KCG5_9SPIR|nr:endolytic transglycosylase MltG [Treponema bryantii]SFI70206.1 UPF0755 protein [Treponema bryantii]